MEDEEQKTGETSKEKEGALSPQTETEQEEKGDGFWDDRSPAAGDPRTMSAVAGKLTKKHKIFISVGAVFVALVFFLIGWFGHFYSLPEQTRNAVWVLDRINKDYYKKMTDEEKEEFYAKLFQTMMPDKFCYYYTPEEFESLMMESNGINMDPGFTPFTDGGKLRMLLVQGNSPAEVAGIRPGMFIYRFGLDENSLTTGTYNELADCVVRSYQTEKEKKRFALECGYTEESKKVYTVEWKQYLASYCSYADSKTSFAFRTVKEGKKEVLKLTETYEPLKGLDDDTAYLRYTGFDGNSDEEFLACLQTMADRGRKNLIIDLRCNGGGYLNLLQSISSHLLRNASEKNPLVATAKYRDGSVTKFKATGNDFETYFDKTDSRITVIADENSASASESLIGALLDYGTITYDDIYLRKKDEATPGRTYGKGVMQSTFTAATGSALRLVTAEINWPKGNNIHDRGVVEGDGADGKFAHGIVAPLVRGESDEFLTQLFAQLF